MKIVHHTKELLPVLGAASLCAILFYAGPVLAAHGLETTGSASGLSGLESDLPTIIGRIIGAVLGFVGVILLLLMIYAGFLWMTAAGNEERVGKAKKIILSSVVGIIIVMMSYAIASFVIEAVAPSGPEGETAGDEEFVETGDTLEESLAPEDIDTLLDDAGIGEAGPDSELLD